MRKIGNSHTSPGATLANLFTFYQFCDTTLVLVQQLAYTTCWSYLAFWFSTLQFLTIPVPSAVPWIFPTFMFLAFNFKESNSRIRFLISSFVQGRKMIKISGENNCCGFCRHLLKNRNRYPRNPVPTIILFPVYPLSSSSETHCRYLLLCVKETSQGFLFHIRHSRAASFVLCRLKY